jgi:hypothetical protein
MKRIKPWIVLALVFIAGVVAGVGGSRYAVRKIIDEATNKPEIVAARLERGLNRQLALTPEQKPRVHEIVEHSQQELVALRKEFQPRLATILKRGERDIRAVLTEEQREKFDRMLKKKPVLPASARFDATPAK